ncbi:MAG: hypothetical protein ACYC0P_15070, partial [Thiobacillus sp.]
MDDVTQQNAALVEEAAAAAESLQDQAAKLAEAVSVFRLEGGASRVQPEPRAQARKSVVIPMPDTLKGMKSRVALVTRPQKREAF